MNSTTTPEYVFSLSDDDVYEWHEDVREAAQEMHAYDENCKTLYMGTVHRFTHSSLLDAGYDIIENMQERAYDEGGEYSDGYLEDIPKEKLADLQRRVSEWLDANVPQPQFYTVDNCVEIEVKLDANGGYLSHRVVTTPAKA